MGDRGAALGRAILSSNRMQTTIALMVTLLGSYRAGRPAGDPSSTKQVSACTNAERIDFGAKGGLPGSRSRQPRKAVGVHPLAPTEPGHRLAAGPETAQQPTAGRRWSKAPLAGSCFHSRHPASTAEARILRHHVATLERAPRAYRVHPNGVGTCVSWCRCKWSSPRTHGSIWPTGSRARGARRWVFDRLPLEIR